MAELFHVDSGTLRNAVKAPRIGEDGWGDAEADDVRERIKLHAEFRVRAGEAGDAAVEGIEKNGEADGARGVVEVVEVSCRSGKTVECGNDGVITAKKIRGGEHRGQKKNAATQFGVAEAALSEGDIALIHVSYHQPERPAAASATSEAEFEDCTDHRARTLEPPWTVSPVLTEICASWGSQMSTREPKRTRPMRSPRTTDSPGFFQETTRRAM